MAKDCLHCLLMQTIDDWRSENPDEEVTEILRALAETMGHTVSLIQDIPDDEAVAVLRETGDLVYSAFLEHKEMLDAESAGGLSQQPRESVH